MKELPLPVDPRYKSSIPTNAKPRPGIVCAGSTDTRIEYYVRGKLVGWRDWDDEGYLVLEMPLRDGRRHGTVYSWYFEGKLTSAEPYFEDKQHGVAKQWSMSGELIGTYRMKHGTGIDLWRSSIGCRDEGPYYLSEVLYFQDGCLHGFRWGINEDQRTVHSEQHYCNAASHGVERKWNTAGRLSRGYPKYFVQGERVDKRRYLRAAQEDATLPPFRLADNRPARKFPPEIQRHLLKTSKQ